MGAPLWIRHCQETAGDSVTTSTAPAHMQLPQSAAAKEAQTGHPPDSSDIPANPGSVKPTADGIARTMYFDEILSTGPP